MSAREKGKIMDNISEKSTSEALEALKEKIESIDYTKDPEYLEFRKYQIAKNLNIPVEALTGDTVEENISQGVALAVYIKNQQKNTPPINLNKLLPVMSKRVGAKIKDAHEKEVQNERKSRAKKNELKESTTKLLDYWWHNA